MSENGRQEAISIAERHARVLIALVGVAFFIGVTLGLLFAQYTLLNVVVQPLILIPIMFYYKRYCLDDLELPADETGDSVYYLGFLFTATSLAAGLLVIGFRLQQTDGEAAGGQVVISLLPAFATALFTTIVGLCVRVTLSQQVGDPTHIETDLRDELLRAARRLKDQTDLATAQFSQLVIILTQKTAEMDAAFESYSTALQSAFQDGSLKRPAEQLQESATQLRAVSNALSASSLDFGEQLQPALGALTAAARDWSGATDEHSAATKSQAGAMAAQASAMKAQSDAAEEQLRVMKDVARRLAAIRGRSPREELAVVAGRAVQFGGYVIVAFVVCVLAAAGWWSLTRMWAFLQTL